ncbi:cation diffusion facilitator family transporter [Dietzia cinnamea]|uniref:Cation diffusion facilitator family transporter n=1 Tax=Dietzia cinnamea TaxID=321318 RepID=A0ABV3YF95_9ACTN|nr:cation diffusion facilitator family transporter [Dietzia cinnamea]MCT1884079.1 cation diffusion facilitator family transporter [Dietzia cinnamea]MCT2120626.1 cation diffusion facilitator family transporter [Dietzia cinnamea]MCT2138585.1 cation diffusion facilitator family transporter [Dietzia cinnamea]MCT2144936.1 cation diffusion facilitator family transporter [Dietzia cinnamea]MCT2174306.1 cation diffusion facilitator family transporter [Dietzia cinnamea]
MSTLKKFAWLSVATAIVTIALKVGAWWVTGSVGLLSDAAESVVNLVAAAIALGAISVSERPADDDHQYGHSKAEYFSAGVEGAMIFVAAAFILVVSVERLINPAPLEALGVGLAISVVAALLNGVVGLVLVRAGIRHRSPTLRADGKHLITDVITSVGVVVGVALAWATGWQVLDPIVAIGVGLNILFIGYRLVHESGMGLMDATLPDEDNRLIEEVLERHREPGRVDFHELRTRESGKWRFVEFHALVPGRWTVERGHDLVETVEQEIHAALPNSHITTHLEPIEDERAYNDVHL